MGATALIDYCFRVIEIAFPVGCVILVVALILFLRDLFVKGFPYGG